jgi:hypothetical protein
MADKKVPLGISIITILMYIGAILDVAAGIFVIVDKAALASASGLGETSVLYYGISLLVIGVIVGLLANGLRSASEGVRLIIAIVMVIRFLVGVWVMIAISGARFEGLAAAIIALVVVYFLYANEDSKEFFA